MDTHKIVSGLNLLLSEVEGSPVRCSQLLAELGFTLEQVDLIRRQGLRAFVSGMLTAVEALTSGRQDGDLMYAAVARLYGLHGGAPEAIATIAVQLRLQPNHAADLASRAMRTYRSQTAKNSLRKSLHRIALEVLDDLLPPPAADEIVARLDALAELRASTEETRRQYQARREEIMAEVQGELDALDAEYEPLLDSAAAYDAQLAAEIKNGVLRHRSTVRDQAFTVVYNRGGVRWDSKGLSQYSEAHPEILRYQRRSAPSVSIRTLKRSV